MRGAVTCTQLTVFLGLLAVCLLVFNVYAMPPQVPFVYDPVTKSIIKTPTPVKPAGVDEGPLPAAAVTGARPCLVILLEFSDNLADQVNHPSSAYNNLLFSNGVVPTGSMKEYYEEVSYGQFTVTGQVTPWLTAPQTYAYYVAGNYGFSSWPTNAQKMTYDACAVADPTVDFSQYDSDGPDGIPNSGDDDGFVDGLFVVHAGPGAEETSNVNDIWSHKWSIPGYYTTGDAAIGGGNIRVYIYSTEPEEFASGALQTIGVFAHEFCHQLGMPDLYDYDSGYINVWDDDNRPLYDWCLMSHGSWGGPAGWGDGSVPAHPSAWIKEQLGWITPTTLTSSQYGVPINDIETTNGPNTLYKVVIADHGGGNQEYFYIENRFPNSPALFDKYDNNNYSGAIQKDAGVVIYHVDDREVPNDDGPWSAHYAVWTEDPGMIPDATAPTTNVAAPHYLLKSDAAFSVEDGQTDFNLNTGQPYHYCYPGSDLNNGGNSGVAIQVVSPSGPNMVFNIGIGHEVNVMAPAGVPCDGGQSVNLVFTITNPGGYNETYALTATSSHGFTLAFPATVGPVAPFASVPVTVVLTVPASYTSKVLDFITLRATSSASALTWHEATTQSPIAVTIAAFDAVAARGGVELRSEFVSETGIERVNVYRGEGNGPMALLRSVDGTNGGSFSYFDAAVQPGKTYRYQIGVADEDGEFMSRAATVKTQALKLALHQNHPNPFNPTTTIAFTLPEGARVNLAIFNSKGELVRTLLDETMKEGYKETAWEGRNDRGNPVSSGVYFYRLTTGKKVLTKKMILLK
jgi:M6 family metalloprotease-like protein